MSWVNDLQDNEALAAFARGFLGDLIAPAFGSRSKGEIEALIVSHLVSSGLLSLDVPTYDLARKFNVGTAKARALTLQYQLRSNLSDAALDGLLRQALANAQFGRDGTYMTFGLESPLLKEHLTAHLKRRGVFADSSFSREIVRLPVDAFIDFVASFLQPGEQEAIRATLVKYKLVEDTSFKGVAKGILKKLAEKVGDKALGTVADGAFDHMTEFVRSLVNGDADEAGKIVEAVIET